LRQTEAQLGMEPNAADPPADDHIATVLTATANRDDARGQMMRSEQLSARGLLPPAERDMAQTRLKIAEASFQSAIETVRSLKAGLRDRQAGVALAQKKLNDATIRAPVAGSVSERLVRPGSFIRESTPVVTLVQLDPLRLNAAIQERHAGIIHAGLPVQFRVESYPDRAFAGKVTQVSPSVDAGTRTFAIEAEVLNGDRRLKPGFFANGAILTDLDQNVMGVPEDAVSTVAGVSSVFVVESNKVRQVTVTVGERQGKLFELLSGLDGRERLASSNLNQLATGVPVKVRDGGAAQSTPAAGRGSGPGGAP
jgi:RND family efflux transporter MFP subunit